MSAPTGHPSSVAKSPESDVSPTTIPPDANAAANPHGHPDYFSIERRGKPLASDKVDFAAQTEAHTRANAGGAAAPTNSHAFEHAGGQKEASSSGGNDSDGSTLGSRKSSVASVSFRRVTNPALPQGHQKSARYRSPSPDRFRQHVAFDNIPVGEATKNNTLGYTLSISHHGYHPGRRSRTLMVGVDQHVYSDIALQWLLDEYADDGDEIICVHVTDKDARGLDEKSYKARADAMVERIKKKIPDHCAISVTLEYAVGKLHSTFLKLIQVYEPSMLVVGTKGRSLGGFQGLVNANSFSKYCLQYSPIPTVVVRDYEKRKKKKDKRTNNPSRHSYATMLAANRGKHEADSENSSLYDMEARLSPDEEAHKVAAAIGLPAAFDPTLKPLILDPYIPHQRRVSGPTSPSPTASPKIGAVRAAPADSVAGDSEEEESDEEFEVMTGQQAIAQSEKETEKEQKKRLHEMEVNEAAALKFNVESDEDEDDESNGGGDLKG